jgi:hypothetical protein
MDGLTGSALDAVSEVIADRTAPHAARLRGAEIVLARSGLSADAPANDAASVVLDEEAIALAIQHAVEVNPELARAALAEHDAKNGAKR